MIRRSIPPIAISLLVSSGAVLMGQEGAIRNDTVWHDTDGNEMWCNGGHIICQADLFYWVGYDTAPGHWPWKINLYCSRDLATWKFLGTVIRREGKFARLGWAGRPALLHHKETSKYIIILAAESTSTRAWPSSSSRPISSV